MRRIRTSAESTFGTGRNTLRDIGRTTSTSQASWTSTEGIPYAFVPGFAASRPAISRCTIKHHSSVSGNSSIVFRMAGVATP